MINSVKLHFIIVYKHEMDLKFMHRHSRLKNALQEHFFKRFIEIKFDYKYKYIAQILCNIKKFLLKQKVITKMMNHNNEILSSKTLCFYTLIFILFLLKRSLNHNSFCSLCLLEVCNCHIMIFNIRCEMRSITYT